MFLYLMIVFFVFVNLPVTFAIVICSHYVFRSEGLYLIIHILQPRNLLVHTIAISNCILRIDLTLLQLFMSVISLDYNVS